VRALLLGIWLCVTAVGALAQRDDYRLSIRKAETAPKIDGRLDEAVWQGGEPARRFYQNFPYDSSYARIQTEVWAAYDADHVYFAALCYRTSPEVVISSLRRDFDGGTSDVFTVFLDPFNDQTNGFLFSVSPLGVQREGLVSTGNNIDLSWDNAWQSAVVQHDTVYVVEMAIPLSTLRYSATNALWRVNFARGDLTVNEYSSWVPVPRNFGLSNLLFTGRLEWPELPPPPRREIAVIPYALGSGNAIYQPTGSQQAGSTTGYNFGGDVKLPVSSSLNLDLTVNPDFAQADVDVQQINLSRFNLFFPERRQFFIENSDLFARFGFSQVRPFFSRQIGLQTPIIAGARLSGKVGRDWRVGLMTVQTEGDAERGLSANNYTVAAVQRQVFGASNVGLIAVNRQGMNGNQFSAEDYNRVIGVDFNLQVPSNKWRGKAYHHVSFSPTQEGRAFSNGAWLMYNVPKFAIEWNHEWVGRGFRADVGFVPRLDYFDPVARTSFRHGYFRIEPEVRYVLFPKQSSVNRITFSVYNSTYFLDTLSRRVNDGQTWVNTIIQFQNSAETGFAWGYNTTDLIYASDFGLDGSEPLLPIGRYSFSRYGTWFYSNARKPLYFTLEAYSGGFFGGQRHYLQGQLFYRWQPWGTFSVSWEHNDLQFEQARGRAQLNLVGVRAELSFSKSLFWTTFVQYNSQGENLNHFSRLQWRFAPMSDLFIVYSENYDPQVAIKNRFLVIKLVYWLRLRV